MIELTKSVDGHTEQLILLADVDGETVGNFRLTGSIGHHADLAFRWWKDGPREVRFPMADAWPTEAEAARIVAKYVWCP